MRSLAVARGTGDPRMGWSFRFIDLPAGRYRLNQPVTPIE